MNFSDVQHYILVKFCLVVFVTFGMVGIHRKWKPWKFLLLMGVTCASGYLLLTQGLQLMFWGLTGDEITIAAMYETFAHSSLWSDFAYAGLPPFYPALWFWVWSLLGRVFNWNGIQIAKWASAGTMLVYPLVFYGIQKLFWRKRIGDIPKEMAWFHSSIFLFLFVEWDAILMKPYEMVSASLCILWTQFLMVELWNGKEFTKKKIVWFGTTGGVLFLLFYFWFFLAAIGIAIFHLLYKKVSWKQYALLGVIGILTLAIGSVYFYPLMKSYALHGAENWQLGFFTHEWLATNVLAMWSISGVFMFFGFIALVVYRERVHIRILLSLFAASYLWQLMGYVTIYFFASPLQETKGFYFFNRAILAMALAYGVQEVWTWLNKKYPTEKWQKTMSIIGLLALSTQLFFGVFVDQEKVLTVRSRARKMDPYMGALVSDLKKEFPDIQKKTTLESGLHELHAFIPLNDFVYFNIHNSHPAARFSERFDFVKQLAASKDAKAFYGATQHNAFAPIDVFVFYTGDPKFYPMYFHLDNFPNELREEVVNIPRMLFDEKYFQKTFQNKDYVVFVPKKM